VTTLMPRSDQKKLELIIGDFVKADLPYFDVCISNTPYQVCPLHDFHMSLTGSLQLHSHNNMMAVLSTSLVIKTTPPQMSSYLLSWRRDSYRSSALSPLIARIPLSHFVTQPPYSPSSLTATFDLTHSRLAPLPVSVPR